MEATRLIKTDLKCSRCEKSLELPSGSELMDGIFTMSVLLQRLVFQLWENNETIVCISCKRSKNENQISNNQ